MIIQALVFYVFAAVTVLSALLVITARNPVHSVLFLILTFFSTAALFLLIGAEFVAMILVIVYVGAVAVLFLFVVMMLDIDFEKLRSGAMRYLPIGALVGAVLLCELVIAVAAWKWAPEAPAGVAASVASVGGASNTAALGRVIYTQYFYLFQMSGLILLVAMIGAIVLTLRTRVGVRRQRVADQNAVRPQDVLQVRKVPSREGI
jgi:NADH-quinone oxidoreductase subunit J